MNFDDAITAHTEWKTKLLRYIENPDGSLAASAIQNDEACKLGTWIHGPATKYHYLPEYNRLVTDHAAFHKQAAIIVDKINHKEPVSANDVTHPDGPYVIASRNVIDAILCLRRKIGNQSLDASEQSSPSPPLESAPAFLKISAASPEITQVIMKTAAHTTEEIAILIKAYGEKPLPPALLNMIRESILIHGSNMFMQILDVSKGGLKKEVVS